ncbi:MAG: HlyC/CorC family transporter [Planctomycetes bacterium]|nr:HlyC/CorC family transporter [Planctomycetota bacterium]
MELSSLAIFTALLALSAFFSGTETALTAISDVTLQKLCDGGNPKARLLRRMLQNKGRVIATLLIGNNVVNTALAVFSTLVFDAWARSSGVLPAAWAPVGASVSAVVFLLVFGEVLPKSIAVSFSTRWALMAAWPVFLLMSLLAPVTWLLNRLSDGMMLLLGRKAGTDDIFDVKQIHAMANMGEQQGVIDEQEAELIQRASQLNDTRVREIMIPRTDVAAIDVGMSLSKIREYLQRNNFSRIPVHRGELDDIVGVLHYKDFLRHAPERDEDFELVSFLHKPLFVPENMFIGHLLKQMQARHAHMAIVLDEYGGTSGLITLEDVVEMLVGKIDDEYDEISTPIEQVDAATVEADARATDDALFEKLGMHMDPSLTEGFHTVGGLALTAFGNIPSEGDKTTYHGMEITALRVKGNRVRRVRVRKLTEEETAAIGRESSRRPTSRLLPETTGPQPQADSAPAGENNG